MQSAGDTAVNLGKIARFEASLPLLNNWLKDANERQFELPLDDNLRKYPKIVLGTAR